MAVRPARSQTEKRELGDKTVFPGCPGRVHSSIAHEIHKDSELRHQLRELPFHEIVDIAYMFNYEDDEEHLLGLGRSRVSVQLDDSDWCSSFSLDSVGVNQSLSVDDSKRGILELGFHIKVAPGRLSKYTKIVRFMPRFAIFNNLDVNLKVIQPTFFGGDSKEETVSAGCLRPYHLPETEGERSLGIRMEGAWNRSVSFDIDHTGSYTIGMKRRVDLGSLAHVNTRGDYEYDVTFPPHEIGIWFETDWNERNIVIKSLRPGGFASQHTDIQVGDVLLAIDGEGFTGNQFDAALAVLKEKLRDRGCVVTFRTVEEKIRLIRENALTSQDLLSLDGNNREVVGGLNRKTTHGEYDSDLKAVRVDLKAVEATIFISVSPVDPEAKPEYRIENNSICHVVLYKQRGISGNRWSKLMPGQNINYIWEDPFKDRKLLLRIGDNILCPKEHSTTDNDLVSSIGRHGGIGGDLISKPWGYLAGTTQDNNTIEVNLDEIGFQKAIPVQFNSDGKLFASVISDGPTKALQIAPMESAMNMELAYADKFAEAQMEALKNSKSLIMQCLESVNHSGPNPTARPGVHTDLLRDTILKNLLLNIKMKQVALVQAHSSGMQQSPAAISMGDPMMMKADPSATLKSNLSSFAEFDSLFGMDITRTHNLLVEVLEAKELTPFVTGKKENVFCKVYMKSEEKLSKVE